MRGCDLTGAKVGQASMRDVDLDQIIGLLTQ